MTSNVLLFPIVKETDRDLAFALFWNSIFYQICAILLVCYFWSYHYSIKHCLFFFLSLFENCLFLFLWQLVKFLLFFLIKDWIFWHFQIQSFNSDFEFIRTSCSVSTLSISWLNNEHGIGIYKVLFKQSWAKTNCLVCLCIQIIGKLSTRDCQIIFVTRNSNLTLFRTESFKTWCLTLNEVFLFENTNCLERSLSSEEFHYDICITVFKSGTVNGQFCFSC